MHHEEALDLRAQRAHIGARRTPERVEQPLDRHLHDQDSPAQSLTDHLASSRASSEADIEGKRYGTIEYG
jgi:hypothetical protein